MFDVKGMEIGIIGCGETGFFLSLLLKRIGANPHVLDSGSDEDLNIKAKELAENGISIKLGNYNFSDLKEFETVVISPGVDPTKSPIFELQEMGKEIIGDIELIYRLTNVPFVCITGTNGKTTTTRLISHILNEDGKKVVMGGNMKGHSLASQWNKIINAEFVVCEVSSFQLESIREFKPFIACYLNISPDHIDRYPDFESYFNAKNRIYMNMDSYDHLILNYNCPALRSLESEIESEIYYFSLNKEVNRGVFLKGDEVFFRDKGFEKTIFHKDLISLKGNHNLENVLASLLVSEILKVDSTSIEKSVGSFELSEHTLEFVANVDGVKFVNDSKGTNVDSVIQAINSFDEPVILLAGGKDKGCDYNQLSNYLENKVRLLILFGEARDLIASKIKTSIDVFKVKRMVEAIELATKLSIEGDIVLLSPACSSFDEFRNYEHRGKEFKRVVQSFLN